MSNLISKSNINKFKIIGPRATLGLVLNELAENEKNLMVLTSDVSTSAGLDRFRNKYQDKYLDVGIAEQNLIGVASGLASEGYKVFTTTFAPFQTLRCLEQIKVNLGYMKLPVKMVGIASGLVLGSLGFTHCSIEDIGAIRSIPNITIISPADTTETAKAIVALMDYDHPVYLRLTGGANSKLVFDDDYKFEIGKPIEIKKGEDLKIFCTGATVASCLEVYEELKLKNISASIINVHTLKPIIDKHFENFLKNSKNVFTAEEHNIIGGLGSIISELIAKNGYSAKLKCFGVSDIYSKGGDYKNMLEKNRLDSKSLMIDIMNSIK